MVLKNEQGQTMVEYILLLAVVVSLVLTLYNTKAFRDLFGDQGAIGKNIKAENEFAYRHGFMKKGLDVDVPIQRNISSHPSYADDQGDTRFFGPEQPYQ